jgi:hypothetical protein
VSHLGQRGARDRARLTDPTGAKHSRTFSRKADAQRFLRKFDAELNDEIDAGIPRPRCIAMTGRCVACCR